MAVILKPNMALNLAPFSRWTLRDKAAQRRLAPRYVAFSVETMNIEEIYRKSAEFRNAIELISSSLGISFSSFPRGACGDAVPLLGTYLIENGLGDFQYVLGDYGSRKNGTWSSHAWLQAGNLVVDITADQFADVSDKVIVSANSDWHAKLNGVNKHVADYRIYDSHTVHVLGQIYIKIIEQINAT